MLKNVSKSGEPKIVFCGWARTRSTAGAERKPEGPFPKNTSSQKAGWIPPGSATGAAAGLNPSPPEIRGHQAGKESHHIVESVPPREAAWIPCEQGLELNSFRSGPVSFRIETGDPGLLSIHCRPIRLSPGYVESRESAGSFGRLFAPGSAFLEQEFVAFQEKRFSVRELALR